MLPAVVRVCYGGVACEGLTVKYVVFHHHPEKLVMSQLQRDLLFATGTVVGVFESPVYSLQEEMLGPYQVRPLTVVLWGMANRYGLGFPGMTIVEVTTWSDARAVCAAG